jgi:hypothetical protein
LFALGWSGCDPCGADTDVDPRNCGACGHDCQGGACVSGVCQAFAFGANQQSPIRVAVTGDDVVWLNDILHVNGNIYAIMKAPRSGGDPVMLATGCCQIQTEMFADESGVYWTTMIFSGSTMSSTLMQVSLAGGPPRTLMTVPYYLGKMVTDANYVYTTASDGAIHAFPKVGGPPKMIAMGPSGGLGGIFLRNGLLYAASKDGVIVVPTSGGQASLIAQTSGAVEVGVDATSIYWTASAGIMRLDMGSSRPPTLLNPNAGIGQSGVALHLDDTRAYWGNGWVFSASKNGGDLQIYGQGADFGGIMDLALDESAIYVADPTGTIWKVAK